MLWLFDNIWAADEAISLVECSSAQGDCVCVLRRLSSNYTVAKFVFFPHTCCHFVVSNVQLWSSTYYIVTCFLSGSKQPSELSLMTFVPCHCCFLSLLSSWKSRRSSWKRKCRSFRNISCLSRREHGERLQGRVTLSRYMRINKDGWMSWMQVGAIFWAAKCTIFHQGQWWLTFCCQHRLASVIHRGSCQCARGRCEAHTIITAERLHAALLLLNNGLKWSD